MDASAFGAYFGIPAGRRRSFSLAHIQGVLNTEALLQNRKKCSVEEFTAALDMRERAYGMVSLIVYL